MTNAARRPVPGDRRRVALALFAVAAASYAGGAAGQVGPIANYGFLEYQYRLTRREDAPEQDQHLATWRTQASTFLWRPWILMLDGDIGLTRTRSANSGANDTGTIVTGGLSASAFARSTFPFRIYFESRDSRVDGEVFDTDLTTRNWGFSQQLASRRSNGRLGLEYRSSDTDEISVNGRTNKRSFGSELWQLTGSRLLGRNDLRLVTSLRKLRRDFPEQHQDRKLLNFSHKFRSGLRFNMENRLFYSDEAIRLNGGEQHRRFLQFNGVSTWRPDTSRPLLVIGRVVAQGVEAGNGTTRGSQNFLMSGAATYQYSPQTTFAASAGVDGSNGYGRDSEVGTFQRLRATYRSIPVSLAGLEYNWGGSLDAANRRAAADGNESIQTAGASFNQGLTRATSMGGGRQFRIGLTQTAAALADTHDRSEQTLVHTAYATLSRQNGRTSSMLRFSASDRRGFGDRGDEFQMLSLNGSWRMQINRTRSLNGGIALTYTDSAVAMMNGTLNEEFMVDQSSLSYNVNLSYVDRELFSVNSLQFISELRYLSTDFRSEDIFDFERRFDPQRSDSSWRNELSYRVGLLQLRLLAEVRDINGRWVGQAFFSVRRYYGTT